MIFHLPKSFCLFPTFYYIPNHLNNAFHLSNDINHSHEYHLIQNLLHKMIHLKIQVSLCHFFFLQNIHLHKMLHLPTFLFQKYVLNYFSNNQRMLLLINNGILQIHKFHCHSNIQHTCHHCDRLFYQNHFIYHLSTNPHKWILILIPFIPLANVIFPNPSFLPSIF